MTAGSGRAQAGGDGIQKSDVDAVQSGIGNFFGTISDAWTAAEEVAMYQTQLTASEQRQGQ
jgi:hypothetical protein